MIRQHVLSNFKNAEAKDFKDSICMIIKDGDEEALPGLGVLFECLWENSSDKDKENILNILVSATKKL